MEKNGLGWSWEAATPLQRGEWVRQHAKIGQPSTQQLCNLFNLTHAGITEILLGADWQPEFDRDHRVIENHTKLSELHRVLGR